jgi:hypothetical protein
MTFCLILHSGLTPVTLLLLLCSPRAEAMERAEDSVFREGPGGVFRLKEGLLFHMFVSSSPCGDARLHCPYGTAAMSKEHPDTCCGSWRRTALWVIPYPPINRLMLP